MTQIHRLKLTMTLEEHIPGKRLPKYGASIREKFFWACLFKCIIILIEKQNDSVGTFTTQKTLHKLYNCLDKKSVMCFLVGVAKLSGVKYKMTH